MTTPRPPETITAASVRLTPPSTRAVRFHFGGDIALGDNRGNLHRRAAAGGIQRRASEGAPVQGDQRRAGLAAHFGQQLTGVHRAGGKDCAVFDLQRGDICQHASVQVNGCHGSQLAAAGGGGEEDGLRGCLTGQFGQQAAEGLGPEVAQRGVLSQQHLGSAILEGQRSQPSQVLTEGQGGHAAAELPGQGLSGAQGFPRSAQRFTVEMVEVNPNLVHSTFSARILSASFSAMSCGLEPVMISVATWRWGGFSTTGQLTTG